MKRKINPDGKICEVTEKKLAGTTGLEPATSDVTGRRSNQLNYDSALNSEVRDQRLEVRKTMFGL